MGTYRQEYTVLADAIVTNAIVVLKSADKKISTPKLTSFSVRLAFFPGQVFVWVINGDPRICEDIISPFPIKADGSCLCDHRRCFH